MLYIVLGMHKSGTTLVSEILHKSGILMGDDIDLTVDYDKGNKYERLSTFQLNLDVLNCHDIRSLNITLPKSLQLNEQYRQRMLAIIREGEATNTDWGFKDPRTCLTYHMWKESLPDHKLIAIYRHPAQVYYHYKARKGRRTKLFLVWRLMWAWTLHNAQIVSILRDSSTPYLVLSYEQLMTEQEEFNRLSAFTGRQLVDARRVSSYRKRSRHSHLINIADLVFGMVGVAYPSKVMQELEQLRSQQLRIHIT